MAKQRLASMPLGALMKLRDRVGAVIDRRATALKKELRSLGEDYTEVGRIAIYGRKKKTRKRRTAAKSAQTLRVKRAKPSAKKRKGRGSRRRAQ